MTSWNDEFNGLKLNVAAVLEYGDGRSPVPPAITPNHDSMNRLLRIAGRKNNFSLAASAVKPKTIKRFVG